MYLKEGRGEGRRAGAASAPASAPASAAAALSPEEEAGREGARALAAECARSFSGREAPAAQPLPRTHPPWHLAYFTTEDDPGDLLSCTPLQELHPDLSPRRFQLLMFGGPLALRQGWPCGRGWCSRTTARLTSATEPRPPRTGPRSRPSPSSRGARAGRRRSPTGPPCSPWPPPGPCSPRFLTPLPPLRLIPTLLPLLNVYLLNGSTFLSYTIVTPRPLALLVTKRYRFQRPPPPSCQRQTLPRNCLW